MHDQRRKLLHCRKRHKHAAAGQSGSSHRHCIQHGGTPSVIEVQSAQPQSHQIHILWDAQFTQLYSNLLG